MKYILLLVWGMHLTEISPSSSLLSSTPLCSPLLYSPPFPSPSVSLSLLPFLPHLPSLPPHLLPKFLLSQAHRLQALELLGRFLDLGPWAVHSALSVGIFPYVLKLLGSKLRELQPILVFIWAKILSVDPVSGWFSLCNIPEHSLVFNVLPVSVQLLGVGITVIPIWHNGMIMAS